MSKAASKKNAKPPFPPRRKKPVQTAEASISSGEGASGVMMGIRNRFQRVAATQEQAGKQPWTIWQIMTVVLGVLLILAFVLGMGM